MPISAVAPFLNILTDNKTDNQQNGCEVHKHVKGTAVFYNIQNESESRHPLTSTNESLFCQISSSNIALKHRAVLFQLIVRHNDLKK